MRAGLAGGLLDWSTELGFALPAPAEVLAGQVIALLLGAAFQFRLDPASMPSSVVVDGIRRLLALPATDLLVNAPSSQAPSSNAPSSHAPSSQARST